MEYHNILYVLTAQVCSGVTHSSIHVSIKRIVMSIMWNTYHVNVNAPAGIIAAVKGEAMYFVRTTPPCLYSALHVVQTPVYTFPYSNGTTNIAFNKKRCRILYCDYLRFTDGMSVLLRKMHVRTFTYNVTT